MCCETMACPSFSRQKVDFSSRAHGEHSRRILETGRQWQRRWRVAPRAAQHTRLARHRPRDAIVEAVHDIAVVHQEVSAIPPAARGPRVADALRFVAAIARGEHDGAREVFHKEMVQRRVGHMKPSVIGPARCRRQRRRHAGRQDRRLRLYPVPLPMGEGTLELSLRIIQGSLLPWGEGQGEGRLARSFRPPVLTHRACTSKSRWVRPRRIAAPARLRQVRIFRDCIEIARHQRERLAVARLRSRSRATASARGIAGQMKSANALDRDNETRQQERRRGVHSVAIGGNVRSAPRRHRRARPGAADGASNRLCMEAAVGRVGIFGPAGRAHRERPHDRGGAVIGVAPTIESRGPQWVQLVKA